MRMVDPHVSRRSTRAASTRATNLSLDAALVDEAKALGVNLSLAAAWGLEQAVAQIRADRWVAENRGAFDSYNESVEEHGLPLEKFRLF